MRPIETKQVDNPDYVNRIIRSGELQQITRLLASVGNFSNSVLAEMACAELFTHPNPAIRFAVIAALVNIAEYNELAFDFTAKEFFESELAKSGSDSIIVLDETKVLELYSKMASLRDWSLEHPKLTKSTCCDFTSWAYLIRDELDTCSPDRLHDLSQSNLDYSKSEQCGRSIDNIDGMITIYCCPNCQVT